MKNKSVSLLSAFIGVFFFCFAPVTNADSQISFTATSSTAANLDNVTVYSQFPDGPTDDFYLFNTDGSYETVIGAGTYFVDSGTLTMDQLLVPVGSGTVHFVFVPANSSAVGCDTSYSACLASNTPTEEETFDVLP